MTQFSHADFGGLSQWSPGMSMVGDMFNTLLKSELDALCRNLATHLDSSETGEAPAAGDEVSYRPIKGAADRWPAGLGRRPEQSSVRRFSASVGNRRPRRDHRVRRRSHRIFGVAQDLLSIPHPG